MKVLLVEDEKNFGFILSSELARGAYDVDHAADGVEAVLKFIRDRHDIVLMDLRLPRLQGMDAVRIIKAVSPSVPVIAFSGHADDREMAEAVSEGAALCLRKPFGVSRLKEEMAKLLSSAGGKVHG